jgi:hypothetical protein
VREQELTLILVDLLTRITLALETIADAVASHAEVFTAANDEGAADE